MLNLTELFEKYEDEYLSFSKIENPVSKIPDLCAFKILESLNLNISGDIVSSAGHDEIFLNIDTNELAKTATEADILTLIRCGVRFSEQYDCLSMFV